MGSEMCIRDRYETKSFSGTNIKNFARGLRPLYPKLLSRLFLDPSYSPDCVELTFFEGKLGGLFVVKV